jgi:hypothetical protein
VAQFNYTPIRMDWFYSLDGGRTKLNWFLMEAALEYYHRIRDSQELEHYRELYSEEQVAQFCAYYSRRMKKGILEFLRGRAKHVVAREEYISDFYPGNGGKLNAMLHGVAMEAWKSMAAGCKQCPHRCLADYESRTALFEEWENEGE